MATPRKLGTLVAIPVKGRKLLNKTRGKQSPYVQLKLGDQTKRTKASLIASLEPEWDQEIRLEVFQGTVHMHVSLFDEGKKNELIGTDILLLHEVIDKGELDVWFPIKHNGRPAGEIYFELTFYAVAPLPPTGGPTPHTPYMQIQHPPLRYIQPGFVPPGQVIPNTPPVLGYGSVPGPPASYPGNIYQHPAGYGPNGNPQPYPVPQQHPYPPPQPSTSMPYGRPPNRPGFNPALGVGTPPFQPKAPGGYPPQPFPSNNSGFGGPQVSPSVRFPGPQQPSPGGPHHGAPGPAPRPAGPGYGHNFNGRPNNPANNQPDRRPPPGSIPVTPLVQYNYTLGNFP
ncbi:hypothetical protein BGZ65_006420 [Modicella reniformis]|uniref:C2 domain-containing protein n=1 Tax=Modicella reniformis TaxID=1440133 RepID=A0A9P6MG04_9FUNG|nr:hypothetical protein BGZ65_006420 [Modicella reniformis]